MVGKGPIESQGLNLKNDSGPVCIPDRRWLMASPASSTDFIRRISQPWSRCCVYLDVTVLEPLRVHLPPTRQCTSENRQFTS